MTRILFIYFLFLTVLTFFLSYLPGYNGDLPYYVACIIEKEQGKSADILQKTSSVLANELPPAKYQEHALRISEADKDILDFYRIKPLYITVISGFHSLGFSYVEATLIPSLIAFWLIGVLTFTWALRVLNPVQAIIISILLLIINPTMILARLSTPDSISSLILLASLYFFYFNRNIYVLIALLMTSVGIRMDNFVAALIMLTGLKLKSRFETGSKLTTLIYIVSVFFIVLVVFGMNYFIQEEFFWFRRITYTVSPDEYLRQVLIYFQSFSESFIIGIIVFAVAIYMAIGFKPGAKDLSFLLMLFSIIAGRFLLFPSYEERFFAAFYISGVLVIAERLCTSFHRTDTHPGTDPDTSPTDYLVR